MLIRLGTVDARLQSENGAIQSAWQTVFDALPERVFGGESRAEVGLRLQLARHVSAPAGDRIYHDQRNILEVYRVGSERSYALHFLQGALTYLPPSPNQEAHGEITPPIFGHGQLEDVTYTTLAPLLRRHATYLLHAAAVTFEEGAVLLVGPSHSGKTTSALALVLGGCAHLASDVVALAQQDGRILAFPTAGAPRVRSGSFELLPALHGLANQDGGQAESEQVQGARIRMTQERWGNAAPVVAVFFPEIAGTARCSIRKSEKPLALARMMEESVDLWDSDALLKHVEFLTALSKQANHFRLNLAPDVDRLPSLIQAVL